MDAITNALASFLSTPTGGWSVTAHVITVGIILATIGWLGDHRIKQERKRQLEEWVRRAQQEKSSKAHKVLSQSINENRPILSAKETRDLVLAKKLDPKENVAFLSKRCHELNLDRDGVNAIAEEFYDEASQQDCD